MCGTNGHVVYSFGHPKALAKQLVVNQARREGWASVGTVAATDVRGYGAIVVAHHPNGHGSVIGAALGKPSARDATSVAIDQCRRLGGSYPKVLRTFRG
jgi:hypothetical protein